MQALIFPLAQAAHLLTACFRFRPTHFKIIALEATNNTNNKKRTEEAEEGSSRRGDEEEEEVETKTNRQEIEIVVSKIVVMNVKIEFSGFFKKTTGFRDTKTTAKFRA